MQPSDLVLLPDMLPAVLAVSLTAIQVVRPVYGPAENDLTDFALDYLNPAGQRLMGLPEQPGGTVLTRFPHAAAEGILTYCRRAFETGEVEAYETSYEADGLAGYFRFQAQRSGEVLVVSFAQVPEAPALAGEALRQSHARELAAQAEAQAQHQRLHQVLMRLSANIALLTGPDHVYTLVNAEYEQLFPGRPLLGRSLRQVIPELEGQGYYELFDRVYQTGEPHYDPEAEAWADFSGTGQLEQRYYRTSLSPIRDTQGQVVEVLNFAVDVTAAVRARQQVEQLNAELTAARGEVELQRRQLHNVLEQAPAMICIFDGPRHTFQFVNPPYQALVGERPLVGQPIAEAMPELAGQPIFALLDQVYQTGETFYAREMLVQLDHQNEGRPDLEKRYYNFIYQARHDLAGAIDGILVFAYEVTPQVLVRQQVQALNEELAATNEELQASNEEFLLTNAALQQTQQELLVLNEELEARVADRTRQLREQSGRIVRLIQEAPAAIAMLDGPALVFELLNPDYQALFPDRLLLGRPVLEALPELLDGPGAALLRQVYETGVTFEGRELLMYFARPGDGQLEARYFDFIYQARYDSAGSINGLMLFGFEVTPQVQARQQVQDLNEELATTNEELAATNEELHNTNTQLTRTNVDLDTFVYTASHDLKAPITNIEGLLLALRDHLPALVQRDELTGRLLGMMQGAVERFRVTIAQLTDVSRLQHAQNQPAEHVLLAAVVEDVRLDLEPTLRAVGAKLNVTIEPDLRVFFAPGNLRSVVYNLLSNALKYHQPGRPAVVLLRAARQATGSVHLTVQDNGLGLTAAQQQRLFGLFQRLHTHVEGTGVGLYMVKRMVENAGGTIAVQSQPGQGSTFSITFRPQASSLSASSF